MYSLMSTRKYASSEPNRNSASAFAIKVLPTPVGPTKRKEPIGRRGSFSPERARRMASAIASIASSWPTILSCSRSSMWSSRSVSASSIWLTGTPVHFATSSAMSSSSTTSSMFFSAPPLLARLVQLLLEPDGFLAQLGGALVLAGGAGGLLLGARSLELVLQLLHRWRHREQ